MTDISTAQATKMLSYIGMRAGQVIGSGECYDLADKALIDAGAKSAPSYGKITATADYKWGRAIVRANARPGDVIQFKNWRCESKTVKSDGSWSTSVSSRPHHTAVVARIDGHGEIMVWEQNVNGSRAAQKNELYFASHTDKSMPGQTTTITVTGTAHFYRPQAR